MVSSLQVKFHNYV